MSGFAKSSYEKTLEAIEVRVSHYSRHGLKMPKNKAPTVEDSSLKDLYESFMDSPIQSLVHVPDSLKKKLSHLLGCKNELDTSFFRLLIEGSPKEIYVNRCYDLDENSLIDILSDCNRDELKVFHLDQCRESMTDKAIGDFLKRSPNGFPALTNLSLGEADLTDDGLAQILRKAPLLRYISVSGCHSLTSHAVEILADLHGSSLKGLDITSCYGIETDDLFSRSLMKFEKLSSLSVSNLKKDALMSFIRLHGSGLTELFFSSGFTFKYALTQDSSQDLFWTIGTYCPNLETLDISYCHFTEDSLGSIAERCQALKSVDLSGTNFRDEAIAAFIELRGTSFLHLCLGRLDVAQQTAVSIAKVCTKLKYLDFSGCNKLLERDVRWIIGHCKSLESINLLDSDVASDNFLKQSNLLVEECTDLPSLILPQFMLR